MVILSDIKWKILDINQRGNYIKCSITIDRNNRKKDVDYIIRAIIGDDSGLNPRFKTELIYTERFEQSIYAITDNELKEIFINEELDKIKETLIMLNSIIFKG